MEVQVYVLLRKPAEKGVVNRLRFAVCAVRVICVAHYMAFGVAHVPEGLFLVNANDSALLVRQEIFAVGVKVAQKPVRDVLALDLCRHLRRKVGSCTQLPCFKVNSPGGGLHLLLERSKLSVNGSDAHRDGRVRVHNRLHLIARLLCIGPERLILPALALCRLEIPFPAVGVGVVVHFPGIAKMDGPVRGHAIRHFQAARHIGLAFVCAVFAGVWQITGPRLYNVLCGLLGQKYGRFLLLEVFGAPAARVHRRMRAHLEGHFCCADVVTSLGVGFGAVQGAAYRADVFIVGGRKNIHALPKIALRLRLCRALTVSGAVRCGVLRDGNGIGPLPELLIGVLIGLLPGLLCGRICLHAVVEKVFLYAGVIFQVCGRLWLCQTDKRPDCPGKLVHRELALCAGLNHGAHGVPCFVVYFRYPLGAVVLDPGCHGVTHGVENPPAGSRRRQGIGSGFGCLLPDGFKVAFHKEGVILLPRLEGCFVKVAVHNGFTKFFVGDGVALGLPKVV